jgi:DNA-binding protein HU-beta
MRKAELAEEIAKITRTKQEAEKIIDVIIKSIQGALAKDEQVILKGLGIFSVKQREARTGRNPQTGATIQIPARKVPVFKPSQALKDAVKK